MNVSSVILLVVVIAAMAAVVFMAFKLFEKTIGEMKESMKSMTEQTLKQRQDEFAQTSGERLAQILDPLKHDLESMQKSVTENKEKQIALQTSMETRIAELLKQSNLTAESANALADALKNRGKVHGDWGEHVLESILEDSGLREGVEFSIQNNVKDEGNANLRPDVIINCPDGKHIIIDAKTSITAYAEALGADTDIEREEKAKLHFRSVKAHVDELAKKNYQTYVDNSMQYALMFIPNEGAYMMALNQDPSLMQYAYNKGVIIVNPTNLMLTLHLVLIAWQQTRQEDNCKAILEQAAKMYDKMITVVDSFTALGNQLTVATKTYSEAMGQLSEGRGNLLRQTEGLKELGVKATKKRSKQLNRGMTDALAYEE
jgi:DNA recombination protein RmuC